MAIISFVLWMPQAYRVWTLRHDALALSGISALTQVLVLINAVGWGIYAYFTQAFWAGAPGIVNFPLALVTLIFILRARRVGKQLEFSQVNHYPPRFEELVTTAKNWNESPELYAEKLNNEVIQALAKSGPGDPMLWHLVPNNWLYPERSL